MARGLIASICSVLLLVVPTPLASQDSHDIEFHALFPGEPSREGLDCDAGASAYDPLRAGSWLQLTDGSGATLEVGVLENVEKSSDDGVCESMASFYRVPDAPVYYVRAGEQAISSRSREELEASGWVMESTFSTKASAAADPSSPTTPTSSPAPIAKPTTSELVKDLKASVDVGSCRRFTERGENDPFEFGALAAIWCPDPMPRVTQVALFRFDGEASMDAYWDWRVANMRPRPSRRMGACADGRQGIDDWAHGELACYISKSDGRAKLRWTDERTHTYGVIDASDKGLCGSATVGWRYVLLGRWAITHRTARRRRPRPHHDQLRVRLRGRHLDPRPSPTGTAVPSMWCSGTSRLPNRLMRTTCRTTSTTCATTTGRRRG